MIFSCAEHVCPCAAFLKLSMRERALLWLGARCGVGALWLFLLTWHPTLGRLWWAASSHGPAQLSTTVVLGKAWKCLAGIAALRARVPRGRASPCVCVCVWFSAEGSPVHSTAAFPS